MSRNHVLLERNRVFASRSFEKDLPIVPKMRTIVLTCLDPRVDPAHVLGLQLGEAVVIRNTGGRVSDSVAEEVATLAFMVSKTDGGTPGPFNLAIMHHTQCGAERFSDPQFQSAIKDRMGIDVTSLAISDHRTSLEQDIQRLRADSKVPSHIVVSGLLYDVSTGLVSELFPPEPLGQAKV